MFTRCMWLVVGFQFLLLVGLFVAARSIHVQREEIQISIFSSGPSASNAERAMQDLKSARVPGTKDMSLMVVVPVFESSTGFFKLTRLQLDLVILAEQIEKGRRPEQPATSTHTFEKLSCSYSIIDFGRLNSPLGGSVHVRGGKMYLVIVLKDIAIPNDARLEGKDCVLVAAGEVEYHSPVEKLDPRFQFRIETQAFRQEFPVHFSSPGEITALEQAVAEAKENDRQQQQKYADTRREGELEEVRLSNLEDKLGGGVFVLGYIFVNCLSFCIGHFVEWVRIAKVSQSPIPCPVCSRLSDGIKLHTELIVVNACLFFYASATRVTCCRRCVRSRVIVNAFINLITLHFVWPFLFPMRALYQLGKTAAPGHTAYPSATPLAADNP